MHFLIYPNILIHSTKFKAILSISYHILVEDQKSSDLRVVVKSCLQQRRVDVLVFAPFSNTSLNGEIALKRTPTVSHTY